MYRITINRNKKCELFFFVLNQIRLRVLAIPLIFCMVGLGHSALYAQTATVTAVNDLSCIGDQIGRNGI